MNISGYVDMLEVYGGKVVEKDLYKGDERFEEENVKIKFCEGIEGSFDGVETVEEGFLDRIPHLAVVEMEHTVKHVGVSPFLEKLMHKNDVIIRGKFNTYAEEFAKKYHLRFLPSNLQLAMEGDFNTRQGVDIITLRMFENGKADINQDNRCQGSSAGSVGGGEISFDIPWDFFKDADAQNKIAARCWCKESVRNNKEFKDFIETARQRYKDESNKKLLILY